MHSHQSMGHPMYSHEKCVVKFIFRAVLEKFHTLVAMLYKF